MVSECFFACFRNEEEKLRAAAEANKIIILLSFTSIYWAILLNKCFQFSKTECERTVCRGTLTLTHTLAQSDLVMAFLQRKNVIWYRKLCR